MKRFIWGYVYLFICMLRFPYQLGPVRDYISVAGVNERKMFDEREIIVPLGKTFKIVPLKFR